MTKFLALSVVSLLSLPAFARLGNTDLTDVTAYAANNSLRPGVYRAQTDAQLQPTVWIMNGKPVPNSDELVISADAGESFHATELSPDEILVTPVRSDDEIAKGETPEQFILTRAEFDHSGLQFLADGGLLQLSRYETGMVDAQSASLRGSRSHYRTHRIGVARAGSTHYGFSRDANGRIAGYGGNCVRVVQSLLGQSIVGNGKNIVSYLLHTGSWVRTNVMKVGTVCSWSGGPGGYGHVGYYDGRCFEPTYGGNCGNPGGDFHLLGCAQQTTRRGSDI